VRVTRPVGVTWAVGILLVLVTGPWLFGGCGQHVALAQLTIRTMVSGGPAPGGPRVYRGARITIVGADGKTLRRVTSNKHGVAVCALAPGRYDIKCVFFGGGGRFTYRHRVTVKNDQANTVTCTAQIR
jgi:hypothetical protein